MARTLEILEQVFLGSWLALGVIIAVLISVLIIKLVIMEIR